jgi:positive regulator of sigma E activity
MTEQVIVLEIDENTAIVGCDPKGACKHCGGESFCNIKSRTFTASIPPGLQIAPGSTVEVFLPPGKTVLAGFVVLIMPLIMCMGGFLLARNLTGSEGIQALIGLTGLAAGFGLAILYRRITATRQLPEIRRRVTG